VSTPLVLADTDARRQLSVAELLARRYAPPEWCLENEITLGERRADWIAFSLWRHRLIGFEVKASRADWLRELTNYEKSLPATEAVDTFFVVAPKGVVVPSEIPAGSGWGLLEIKGNRLYTTVAPKARERTDHMSRQLAARLLARQGATHQQIEYRHEDEIRRKCHEEFKKDRDEEIERLQVARRDAVREREAIFAVLGVRGSTWRPEEKAIKIANLLLEYERDASVLRTRLETLGKLSREGLAILAGIA
jgi:hypothetical protein